MDHFGGMPPIVNQAGRSIESMASQGVSGMTMVGGAALVAVGAIAEVVGASMKGYQDLGDQVENYKRVVGGSAEESSRMVYVFDALNVGADTATAGMFKLSKAIETTPKKLTDLGVVVAHDTAGNIDLSKTLFSVADAYNATGDQAKRNQILFTAFGKSGREMIPVLEQGSAALKNMESSASLLFTQDDLDRLKQAKIHTAEVKSLWDQWFAANIGQKASDVGNAFAESALRGANEQKRLNEAVKAGTITYSEYWSNVDTAGSKARKLRDEWDKQFDTSLKVTDALNSQAQAAQDAAAANDTLWTSADKLITQEEAQVNAGFALEQADLARAESQAKINQAQDAYDKAVKTYGASSDEALLAAGNVTRAQIDQEKSYYAAAAAARKLQEDTDLAATGQKDARKETDAYIQALIDESKTLAPDSPLRKELDAYIEKLRNEIPANVTTKFHLDFDTGGSGSTAGGHGLQAYGAGGRPPVGVPAIVGDKGPEIWTPDTPGTITPNGGAPPTQASVGGDTLSVTVNAQTNADSQDIARDAAWELRRMRRNF